MDDTNYVEVSFLCNWLQPQQFDLPTPKAQGWDFYGFDLEPKVPRFKRQGKDRYRGKEVKPRGGSSSSLEDSPVTQQPRAGMNSKDLYFSDHFRQEHKEENYTEARRENRTIRSVSPISELCRCKALMRLRMIEHVP